MDRTIGFTLTHTVGIILFPAVLASLGWVVVKFLRPYFQSEKCVSNLLGARELCLLGMASCLMGFGWPRFASHIARRSFTHLENF